MLGALGAPIGRPAGAAATVAAEGDVWAFGSAGAPISGQTVRVLEHPGLSAITDGSGHWRIDGLPVGSDATFVLEGDRYPIQTATLTVPDTDFAQVAFQSPSYEVVDALEAILGISTDPGRCQIASTVTRRGASLYAGAPDGTHGEPDATVTIHPTPADVDGPVYFNGLAFDVIWPDRSLAATTVDGGVLFVNVPPGTYTLSAHKDGATIREVTVGCRPGVLTNAAPPWGLQVLTGGLEPGETRPFPTQTTTTTTSTTSTTTAVGPTSPSTSTPVSPLRSPPDPRPSAVPVAPLPAAPRFTG